MFDVGPDRYIGLLPQPRRADVEALDYLVRATAPVLDRALDGDGVSYDLPHATADVVTGASRALLHLSGDGPRILLRVRPTPGAGDLPGRYAGRLPAADVDRRSVCFARVGDVDLEVLVDLVDETTQLADAASRVGVGRRG